MVSTRSRFFRSLTGPFVLLLSSLAGLPPASATVTLISCPPSVIAGGVLTAPPPAGWTGSGESGPYSFKEAKIVNGNRLVCVYVQKNAMAGLARPRDAGATCTFATDQRAWSCRDAGGTTRSYPCQATLMVAATGYGKPPDGWQGTGESGAFPFANAPAIDEKNPVLRCAYRTSELNYSLARPKPAGSCAFDTARMTWTCTPPAIEVGAPPRPAAPTKGTLIK